MSHDVEDPDRAHLPLMYRRLPEFTVRDQPVWHGARPDPEKAPQPRKTFAQLFAAHRGLFILIMNVILVLAMVIWYSWQLHRDPAVAHADGLRLEIQADHQGLRLLSARVVVSVELPDRNPPAGTPFRVQWGFRGTRDAGGNQGAFQALELPEQQDIIPSPGEMSILELELPGSLPGGNLPAGSSALAARIVWEGGEVMIGKAVDTPLQGMGNSGAPGGSR